MLTIVTSKVRKHSGNYPNSHSGTCEGTSRSTRRFLPPHHKQDKELRQLHVLFVIWFSRLFLEGGQVPIAQLEAKCTEEVIKAGITITKYTAARHIKEATQEQKQQQQNKRFHNYLQVETKLSLYT